MANERLELNSEPLDFTKLDAMSKSDAINYLLSCIEACELCINRYQKLMLSVTFGSKDFIGYKHAWEVDLSNLIKFKKVLDEVVNED